MQSLPHHYAVTAAVSTDDEIELSTSGVVPLQTAAPVEFDGPGHLWSPETLLVGAIADCFAITFRGIARASKLAWSDVAFDVIGTLDRVDGLMRFTQIDIHARVTLPDEAEPHLAHRVLDKVKRSCLITNSLTAVVDLHATIEARTIDTHECSV